VSLLPRQTPPVRRPELVYPHRTVDVTHGTADQLVAMRIRLMHGANYNDPQHFEYPSVNRMRVSAAVLP
jgi:cyanobactin biosynthesis protein (PatB/AcyB/McaB family)